MNRYIHENADLIEIFNEKVLILSSHRFWRYIMKCEECSFCKYDNSIKEYVCSIESDLPVVFKEVEINCEKVNPIIKNKS